MATELAGWINIVVQTAWKMMTGRLGLKRVDVEEYGDVQAGALREAHCSDCF